MNFLTTQLIPTYDKLSDILNVELIPLQVSYKKVLKSDGTFDTEFQCMHDLQECIGNRIWGCAWKQESHKRTFDLIECMYNSTDRLTPGIAAKQCSQELAYNWTAIDECSSGPLGRGLQLEGFERQQKVVPPVRGTPWVLLNGENIWSKHAWERLFEIVCETYTQKAIVITIGVAGICIQFVGLWAVHKESYYMTGSYGTILCFIAGFSIAWGLLPGYEYVWVMTIIYFVSSLMALTFARHIRRVRLQAPERPVYMSTRSTNAIIMTPAYQYPAYTPPTRTVPVPDNPPTYEQSMAYINSNPFGKPMNTPVLSYPSEPSAPAPSTAQGWHS
ncbi:unnamed protein product [Oppiella nova]|uniref:Uncharacterized protein n=1 Tax=Oppiella nova TaxID=334625 RepID=A0A7R9QTG9_9ACAR|nr:unnamed protein product [Oppiella nova]CAG2174290.1 unnamed protein product [Oppiella nova]